MLIQTNVVADFNLANQLLEQMRNRLILGEDLPRVPNLALDNGNPFEGLTGHYQLHDGGSFLATADKGELTLVPEDVRSFSALLSVRPVDRARADRFVAKIDTIVSAYLAGNWEPLWEAYRRALPLESLRKLAGGRMQNLEQEFGKIKGHEILGTAFRNGRDVTLVRINFAHGEEYRAYVWDPDEDEKLLGVSGRGLDHQLHVMLEVGGTFATWDVRTGTSLPVMFDTGSGKATRLTLGNGGFAAEQTEQR